MKKVYGVFYRDPNPANPEREYHWAQAADPLAALNLLESHCDVFPKEFDLRFPEGSSDLLEVVPR